MAPYFWKPLTSDYIAQGCFVFPETGPWIFEATWVCLTWVCDPLLTKSGVTDPQAAYRGFVMVHYTCLVQGTNFRRCHLILHTSFRWAPFCTTVQVLAPASLFRSGVFCSMHGTVAPRSRAGCLRARCNAFALPSFAGLAHMHSTMAPRSRALYLRARCKAFA